MLKFIEMVADAVQADIDWYGPDHLHYDDVVADRMIAVAQGITGDEYDEVIGQPGYRVVDSDEFVS